MIYKLTCDNRKGRVITFDVPNPLPIDKFDKVFVPINEERYVYDSHLVEGDVTTYLMFIEDDDLPTRLEGLTNEIDTQII